VGQTDHKNPPWPLLGGMPHGPLVRPESGPSPIRPTATRRADVIFLLSLSILLAALPGLSEARRGAAFFSFGDGGSEPHWGYTGEDGPEHWGELDPVFAACKNGREQSPIDIEYSRRSRGSPLAFHYRSIVLSIQNDGHTIRVNYSPGSYLRVDGHRYELKEFHFHSPSEHRIHGGNADMVAHLVHEDAAGKIAVVAIPFQAGARPNNLLSKIWRHLPEQPGGHFYDRQTGINATFLLPPDRSYFTYRGSLTTPPCSEGVRWFVLQHPVEIDASYIEQFRRLIGANVRPLQPLNGREVLSSRP